MDDSHWNPGGWAAKRKGCTCPRIENRWGSGSEYIDPPHEEHQYVEHQSIDGRSYVINLDCPLHADLARYSPARGQDDSGLPNGGRRLHLDA